MGKNLKKRRERTLRKFDSKRHAVLDYLERRGVDVTALQNDEAICREGYQLFGRRLPDKPVTAPRIQSYFVTVLHWARRGGGAPTRADVRRVDVRGIERPLSKRVVAFYKSAEWKRARYDALAKNDGRCELCGSGKDDGARLNVDHIRPLRRYWELRLDPHNLQVLCASCNQGKGNRDETDWRERGNDNVVELCEWYRNFA